MELKTGLGGATVGVERSAASTAKTWYSITELDDDEGRWTGCLRTGSYTDVRLKTAEHLELVSSTTSLVTAVVPKQIWQPDRHAVVNQT